jgi:hypothetical protein
MAGDPNLKLLEPRFGSLLELGEEAPCLDGVLDVHAKADEVVLEALALRSSAPMDDQRLATYRSEASI